MKNLFIRLYLLLLVAFIGLGWGIDQLLETYSDQTEQTTDLDLHRGTLFLLNSELQRKPKDQRETFIKALQPSFGYPIQLLSFSTIEQTKEKPGSQLTNEQIDYLQQGGIVTQFNDFKGESWFAKRLAETDQIILLGPILNGAPAGSNLVYLLLFLAGLAIIVFAWAMPISRGLVTLTRAATAFGQGDFSVRAKGDLSAPLEELVIRFNAMAERIQRLIKSHKELSHAISHELRTPIARIRFAMEMVREVEEPQQVYRYLNTMDENIEELDGLVDELLTYAKFDREEPKLNLSKHNIPEIVDEVLQRFRQTETDLEFNRVGPATLEAICDRDMLVRILDNLVRNAVRYANSIIEVVLSEQDNRLSLRVNDDGPGVPEEGRSRLFEPFVRLDECRDRKSGGIGLGLAIVKRYIELHQGDVRIGKAELGGASFILSWPKEKG